MFCFAEAVASQKMSYYKEISHKRHMSHIEKYGILVSGILSNNREMSDCRVKSHNR